jgi:hypothetical protein
VGPTTSRNINWMTVWSKAQEAHRIALRQQYNMRHNMRLLPQHVMKIERRVLIGIHRCQTVGAQFVATPRLVGSETG